MDYFKKDKSDLIDLLKAENKTYESLVKEKLSLDMSRGKPCSEQLDLSLPLLDILNRKFRSPGKMDYRNYGILEGIPELRKLFAELFQVSEREMIVGGNSSLNMMYDSIQRALQFGINSNPPWNSLNKVKFLCPSPGYDRHFSICERFGIEMIAIPMTENGPDMLLVEQLVAKDDSIKGIWCVPRFSNPDGIVYSDEVVDKLAHMKTAAKDFIIMWDNAYCVHELYEDAKDVKNILEACKRAGNPNRVLMFGSTSKITFAGAGVGFMAASEQNIQEALKGLFYQTIGFDKLNQYAHYEFLHSVDNIRAIMRKQATILRPKFDLVLESLKTSFGNTDLVNWHIPQGGYFIGLNVMNGCAKRVVELCKNAGLSLTPAGATYPLRLDDNDSNIRIAPTFPPLEELRKACQILVCCIKIAILEKLGK